MITETPNIYGSGGARTMSIDTAGGTLHGVWTVESPLITSDRRLKSNIAPIKNYLERRLRSLAKEQFNTGGRKDSVASWTLRELRPVSFRFNSPVDSKILSRTRIGFIAQEVERIVPEVVRNQAGTDTKALVYQDLLAVVTVAMKDQQADLDRMDDEVLEAQREAQALLDEAERLVQQLDDYDVEEDKMEPIVDQETELEHPLGGKL